MRLFSRRPEKASVAPIQLFWDWWSAEGARRFATAIEQNSFDSITEDTSARVDAMNNRLGWETGPGGTSDHCLYVSSGGDPQLRPLVERWLQAAPPADETWEFASARRRTATPGVGSVIYDGFDVDLSETIISAQLNDRGAAFDIYIFHPVFPRMDETQAASVAFLMLDWMLGEDDVERWIQGIDIVRERPVDGVAPHSFVAMVDTLAGELAEPGYVIATMEDASGHQRLLTIVRPLSYLDHPLLDRHTRVWVRFRGRTDAGLPTEESLFRLRALEDRVLDALGKRGVMLVHETWEGQRLFHFYTDSQDVEARRLIDEIAGPEAAKIAHSLDPGWSDVKHFA